MKSLPIDRIVRALEFRAPSASAEPWDNVGLLVGDAASSTRAAVVCVDLTDEAIAVAKSIGAKLIVNHHPCIFPKGKGFSKLQPHGPSAQVFAAIQAEVSVFASHTNFDRCALEAPMELARELGVEPLGRLFGDEEALIKLVVFVPATHAEKVREAICGAGAGQIGQYDHCTFSSEGSGTFRGGKDAKPFLGKPGKLERAREVKLETILPAGLKAQVLSAMREAHPYEEIAYDLFSVLQRPVPRGMNRGVGYGFYGDLSKPATWDVMSERIKKVFDVRSFLATHPHPKRIRRVGFTPGKGSSFVGAAVAAGCDLLITGETGYHDARSGARGGMAVVEVGHRESERFFLETMHRWLKELGLKVRVLHTPTQKMV